MCANWIFGQIKLIAKMVCVYKERNNDVGLIGFGKWCCGGLTYHQQINMIILYKQVSEI